MLLSIFPVPCVHLSLMTDCILPLFQHWLKAMWGLCRRTDRAAPCRSAGGRRPETPTGHTRVSPPKLVRVRRQELEDFAWSLFGQASLALLKLETLKPALSCFPAAPRPQSVGPWNYLVWTHCTSHVTLWETEYCLEGAVVTLIVRETW